MKRKAQIVNKYSIEDLDDILNRLKNYDKELTAEAVAVRTGYNSGYIAQIKSRKSVPDKYMETLKREFREELKNGNPVGPEGTLRKSTQAAAEPDYKAELIQQMKRESARLYRIVDTNLTVLLQVQQEIRNDIQYVHADLKGATKRNAERFAAGSPKKVKEELDKISIYAGEYLEQGVKEGKKPR